MIHLFGLKYIMVTKIPYGYLWWMLSDIINIHVLFLCLVSPLLTLMSLLQKVEIYLLCCGILTTLLDMMDGI